VLCLDAFDSVPADVFDQWIQMCWWLLLLISEMCCVLMFLISEYKCVIVWIIQI
jgi:hypothetical protein